MINQWINLSPKAKWMLDPQYGLWLAMAPVQMKRSLICTQGLEYRSRVFRPLASKLESRAWRKRCFFLCHVVAVFFATATTIGAQVGQKSLKSSWIYYDVPSLKLTFSHLKWMVGRLISFWDAILSGAVLVLGRVFSPADFVAAFGSRWPFLAIFLLQLLKTIAASGQDEYAHDAGVGTKFSVQHESSTGCTSKGSGSARSFQPSAWRGDGG